MKYFEVFVIALLLPVALATDGITKCDGLPFPSSVDITGCDKAPCILQRGEDVVVTSTFTNSDESEKMTTKVNFREIASGIKGPFPLGEKGNTCKWLEGTDCPVYEGEDVKFKLIMPVLTIYPKNMALELTMTVENEKNKVLSCFKVMATTSS